MGNWELSRRGERSVTGGRDMGPIGAEAERLPDRSCY